MPDRRCEPTPAAVRGEFIEARETTSGDLPEPYRFPLLRGLASCPGVSPGFDALAQ